MDWCLKTKNGTEKIYKQERRESRDMVSSMDVFNNYPPTLPHDESTRSVRASVVRALDLEITGMQAPRVPGCDE